MKYNTKIVCAYFLDCGLPQPEVEFQFHPDRKWRFDFAFLKSGLAIEVQGGLFVGGRHTRGAALLKEHEKLNHAAILGWRIMYFQPSEICMSDTVKMIKSALGILK